MESVFEKVLIDALDALEAGEAAGAILARYPEHEAELRPILSTTTKLSEVRVAHSLEAQAASRQRMLDYAASAAKPRNQGGSFFQMLRRFSLTMAALLLVLAIMGTGVLFASAEAVPGDALYDAKRFFEDSRFSLTNDTAAREELQQLFEETRIREIMTLLRMGRSEDVAFTGIIEAIDDDTWLVAGIEVAVLNTTSISGSESPDVGDLVEVSGVTADGRVNAEVIIIRSVGNLPIPAPEPDEIETATAEPSPTATSTPTPTATRTPTPTPAEATPEPSPTATSTPTPESNENGNDNDNDNQSNGNDNENESESNDNDDDDERNENGGSNSNEGNDNDSNENSGNDNSNSNSNDNDDDEINDNNSNDNRNENDDSNENSS